MSAGDFESRWLSPEVNAVWTQFLTVTHRLEQRIERRLQEHHGISHTQYEIMVRLADADGDHLRMSELAERIVTAKSAVTYQAKRLADMGLVETHKCDHDNRATWVTLTAAGRGRLEEAGPCILSLVREVFLDSLDCDQATALTKILGTLSANLDDAERPVKTQ
ncbi:MarR family winged helix-turn-helix transcriptional regulator [Glycomyces tenuis]|uniref:MarR family winged helix-turn-helix transcriptional regulator n=1 Tax=Glycomyces tenuis TaxID=58116 RepID=UPI00040A88D2|nr:MarR family winged helix-turn-helix transcriptional regulator [Glycomyces tenuis]